MEDSFAALLPGLALGGVVAAGASWSRAVSSTAIPHLGVGAVAGVAIAAAGRLGAHPPVTILVIAALGAALAAALAAFVHVRVAASSRVLHLPDAVVLVVLVGVAQFVQPPTAAVSLTGPLPTSPRAAEAVLAALGGLAVGWMLQRSRPAPERWMVAGALVGVVAVIAGGLLPRPLLAGHPLGMPLPAGADAAGLALRAAVAALAGREPLDAAGAGLGLGLIEAQLRGVHPSGTTALLPAVATGMFALLLTRRRAAGVATRR